MNNSTRDNVALMKSLELQSSTTKLTNILYESSWLIMTTVLFYVILILSTYSHKDLGLFVLNKVPKVHNLGGYVGAWLADLLLFIFGISAWWWCILLLNIIWCHYQRLHIRLISQQTKFKLCPDNVIRMIGFVLLLISSLSIDYMYHITTKILHIPSGILGRIIFNVAEIWFGFTGTTLFVILFFILGCSFFFQISWLIIIKNLGKFFKKSVFFVSNIYFLNKSHNFNHVTKFKCEKLIYFKSQVIKKLKLIYINNIKHDSVLQHISTINLPPLSLLDSLSSKKTISTEILETTSRLIEKKISHFGIDVKVIGVYPGPVITRYEIQLAIGIKSSQILSIARDLARSLSLSSIRVVEIIPGKECIGLELPNVKRQTVHLIEILNSKAYSDSTSSITIALGKDISDNPIVADLSKMPHLLIAGTTGSGKSISMHAIILSILYKSTPKQVRLILIDPKMVELSVYQDIPHLLMPVVIDMHQVSRVLKWVLAEMERRFKYMSILGVRNLQTYNRKIAEINGHSKKNSNGVHAIPHKSTSFQQLQIIVMIIDELADLMMMIGKPIEALIARIAQKARAAGIYLVLATQRPSVDVITGLIKANMPARIAFQLNNKIDSRTILDQTGAETLLGMGDMLYVPPGIRLPIRVHGAFVSDDEIHRVVNYLKKQGTPHYVDDLSEMNLHRKHC